MEEQIKEQLKKAQLERNEIEVSTLRLLLSEITNAKIEKGGQLSDTDIVAVVQKEVKKRKEASDSFRKGGRVEAADKEDVESKILEAFLPAQLSDEELTKIVEESINNVGASSMSDMGKVIGMVMAKVGQSADGGRVSGLVKDMLTRTPSSS